MSGTNLLRQTANRQQPVIQQFREVSRTLGQRVALVDNQLQAQPIGRFNNRQIAAVPKENVDGSQTGNRNELESPQEVNKATIEHFKTALRGEYGEDQAKQLIREHKLQVLQESGDALVSETVGKVLESAHRQDEILRPNLERLDGLVDAETLAKLRQDHGDVAIGLLAGSPVIERFAEGESLLPKDILDQLSLGAQALNNMQKEYISFQDLQHIAQSMIHDPLDLSDVKQLADKMFNLGVFLLDNEKMGHNPFQFLEDRQDQPKTLSTAEALEEVGHIKKTLKNIQKPVAKMDKELGKLIHSLRAQVDQAYSHLKGIAADETLPGQKGELTQIGGKIKNQKSVKIGAEFGTLTSPIKGSGAIEGGLETAQSTRSDTKTEEVKTKSVGLVGKLGNKIHTGKAKVGGAVADGKVYPSPEKFFEADASKKMKVTYAMRKSPEDRNFVSAKLREMGVIGENQALKNLAKAPIGFVKTRARSGEIELGAAILENALSVKGKMVRVNYAKAMPLQDALKQFPTIREQSQHLVAPLKPGNPDYTAEDGTFELSRLKDDILSAIPGERQPLSSENAEKLLEAREKLSTMVGDLAKEFREYSRLVRNTPQRRGSHWKQNAKMLFKQGGEVQELQTRKREMQAARGVKTPEEYFKSVTFTFAALSDLMMKTELPGVQEPPIQANLHQAGRPSIQRLTMGQSALLESLGRELMTPEMPLKPSALLSTDAQVAGKNLLVGGSLDLVLPKMNIALKVQTQFRDVSNHINPDNDGRYVKLGFDLSASVALEEVLGAFAENESFKKLLGLSEEQAKNMAEAMANSPVTVSTQVGGRVEIQFKAEGGGWPMQYVRGKVVGSNKLGGELPPIPIGAPFGIDGSLLVGVQRTTTREKVLNEILGTDTLSYLSKRFNGWAGSEKSETDQFRQLMVDDPATFDKIFQKLANPETAVAKETDRVLQEIGDQAFKDHFNEVMALRNQAMLQPEEAQRGTTLQDARDVMLTFMEKQNGLTKTKAADRIEIAEPRTKGSNPAKKLFQKFNQLGSSTYNAAKNFGSSMTLTSVRSAAERKRSGTEAQFEPIEVADSRRNMQVTDTDASTVASD